MLDSLSRPPFHDSSAFDFALECLEGLVPKRLEPAAQFTETGGVDVVDAARALRSGADEAGELERLQVLRYRGSAHRQARGQFPDRGGAAAQALEHRGPASVGELRSEE